MLHLYGGEGVSLNGVCVSHSYLDPAGAEKTASTAAGSEATEARAVPPGPTSLFSDLEQAGQVALMFDLQHLCC